MNIEKCSKKTRNVEVGDFIYSSASESTYQLIDVDKVGFALLNIKFGSICKIYESIDETMDSLVHNNITIIPSEDVTLTLKSNEWR